jgi:hypothetical protein
VGLSVIHTSNCGSLISPIMTFKSGSRLTQFFRSKSRHSRQGGCESAPEFGEESFHGAEVFQPSIQGLTHNAKAGHGCSDKYPFRCPVHGN